MCQNRHQKVFSTGDLRLYMAGPDPTSNLGGCFQ